MFVVRIIADEGRTDYKAFSRKQDGERRYHAALLRTGEAEVASAALFEVTGTDDARDAVEAVERDDTSRVKLLEGYESPELGQRIQRRRPRGSQFAWQACGRRCCLQQLEKLGAQIWPPRLAGVEDVHWRAVDRHAAGAFRSPLRLRGGPGSFRCSSVSLLSSR